MPPQSNAFNDSPVPKAASAEDQYVTDPRLLEFFRIGTRSCHNLQGPNEYITRERSRGYEQPNSREGYQPDSQFTVSFTFYEKEACEETKEAHTHRIEQNPDYLFGHKDEFFHKLLKHNDRHAEEIQYTSQRGR